MLDNQIFDDVFEIILDVDFYCCDYCLIFWVISQLVELGCFFDVVILGEVLDNVGIFEDSGGMGYLVLLVKNMFSVSNIKVYVEIVWECLVLWQMIFIFSEIVDVAFYLEGCSFIEFLDEVECKVFGIVEQGFKKGGL